jgi:hypothetical protein
MSGLFFTPDRTTRRVEITGSFEVDADMPDFVVKERIFPERAKAFIEQLAKQGYQYDGGDIYLYRRRYAPVEAPDNGSVGNGVYEHDETKRGRVVRKMVGRFLVRDRIVNKEQVMEGLRGFGTGTD